MTIGAEHAARTPESHGGGQAAVRTVTSAAATEGGATEGGATEGGAASEVDVVGGQDRPLRVSALAEQNCSSTPHARSR